MQLNDTPMEYSPTQFTYHKGIANMVPYRVQHINLDPNNSEHQDKLEQIHNGIHEAASHFPEDFKHEAAHTRGIERTPVPQHTLAAFGPEQDFITYGKGNPAEFTYNSKERNRYNSKHFIDLSEDDLKNNSIPNLVKSKAEEGTIKHLGQKAYNMLDEDIKHDIHDIFKANNYSQESFNDNEVSNTIGWKLHKIYDSWKYRRLVGLTDKKAFKDYITEYLNDPHQAASIIDKEVIPLIVNKIWEKKDNTPQEKKELKFDSEGGIKQTPSKEKVDENKWNSLFNSVPEVEDTWEKDKSDIENRRPPNNADFINFNIPEVPLTQEELDRRSEERGDSTPPGYY